MQEEKARYELSLALRSVLKILKHAIGDDMTPYQKERYDAAESMLKKHSEITDVLRTESNEQPVEQKESEAVEFAEWAGWEWRRIEGRNLWENQKTLEVLKTDKLHEKYKEETGR